MIFWSHADDRFLGLQRGTTRRDAFSGVAYKRWLSTTTHCDEERRLTLAECIIAHMRSGRAIEARGFAEWQPQDVVPLIGKDGAVNKPAVDSGDDTNIDVISPSLLLLKWQLSWQPYDSHRT